MVSFLNTIRRLLRTRRINIFFVFFMIAFSILIINKLSKTYSNKLNLKVEVASIPEDIILENENDFVIPVKFENTGFNWLKYVFKQPKTTLDLGKDFSLKTGYFAYAVTKNSMIERLPKNSTNVEVTIDTLRLKFDQLASKKVAIVSNVTVNFSSGYDSYKDLIFIPDSVKIVGSEKEINRINELKTQNVVLESVKKSINKTIYLQLDSLPKSVSVLNKTVEGQIHVQKFTEGEIKIPITIKNKPEDINITFFPKQLTVAYYLPLENFKSVTKANFTAELDYKTISLTNDYVYPELKVKTNQVKSARIKESKIEYIITK